MTSFALSLIGIGGFTFLFGFLFFMPLAWFFTTRYFDKKLKFDQIKDPFEKLFFLVNIHFDL